MVLFSATSDEGELLLALRDPSHWGRWGASVLLELHSLIHLTPRHLQNKNKKWSGIILIVIQWNAEIQTIACSDTLSLDFGCSVCLIVGFEIFKLSLALMSEK